MRKKAREESLSVECEKEIKKDVKQKIQKEIDARVDCDFDPWISWRHEKLISRNTAALWTWNISRVPTS